MCNHGMVVATLCYHTTGWMISSSTRLQHEVTQSCQFHDNPAEGVMFNCDDPDCKNFLRLYFQGRTAERLREGARNRGWIVDGDECHCPAHSKGRELAPAV